MTGPRGERTGIDRIEAILPALVVSVAAMLAFRRLDDPDTWWHLAAGRWIAAHGTVPRTDVLSWTVRAHPWTDVQWLFELALYGLHRAGGAGALVVAATAAHALAVALLLVNLRRALGPVAAAAIALPAVAVAQERFAVRPEMVSFVLLEAVLWLCAGGAAGGRRVWLLPLVMLLWVNTHALFAVGAFIVAVYTLFAALRGARGIVAAGGAALLVTLANPYGVAGVLFPLTLVSRISGSVPVFRTIDEFKPPFSGQLPTLGLRAYQLALPIAVGVVALASLAVVWARRDGDDRFQPAGLVTFLALLVLSVLARRNMALFAMGAAPFVGVSVAIVAARLPARAVAVVRRTLAVVLLGGIIAAGWLVATNRLYRWHSELHEFGPGVVDIFFPARASAFARDMSLPPPLFNDLTSGGWLAWDRPIAGGVYMDGRLEVYDADFFTRYTVGLADPRRWLADADAARIQTVLLFHWWPIHRPLLLTLLANKGWALVYFDETAVVFVRRAGNEDAIARCAAAFAPLHEQVGAELLGPVSGWRWPVARARALASYATLLDVLGRVDEAMPFYARFLDLGPSPAEQAAAALRLAQYHALREDETLAREYLERATRADPANPDIAPLAARLRR